MEKVEVIDGLFFKYRSLELALKILHENKLCFSSPVEFNDPFDSTFWLQNEGTKEEWEEHLYWIDLDEETVEYMLTYELQNMGENIYKLSNNIHEKPFKNQRKFKNHAHILSLSRINNNILMWSHYASNHEGVCLCFKAELKDEKLGFYFDSEFLSLYEVKYQKNIPKPLNVLKPTQNEFKYFIDFFTTKYIDWEYEKEYRLLVENIAKEKKTLKQYEKNSLEGIIFGLYTPLDSIRQIYEIVSENYSKEYNNVNYYECELVEGKYGINPIKIKSFEYYLASKI